ncbi:MAG TPA: sigma-70 family RNA polymerase sigma factor [Povalibacter sp.]|nr:sigma-70 family RNA polymerase sigma factor [Povalibacter sp.]
MTDQTERALDGYLIALIRGGSREAFDRLARRWTPRLLRYAARVLGRQEAARDIVQETWIGAIRGLNRLDDPARFPAWIYGIAHRKCIDGIRFAQRQRRLVSSIEQESALAAESALRAVPGESADLAVAISRLNHEQRDVVHLFYGEDLGIDDIASILNVPAGTVKSRLHHAREYLRKQLGD